MPQGHEHAKIKLQTGAVNQFFSAPLYLEKCQLSPNHTLSFSLPFLIYGKVPSDGEHNHTPNS